MVLHGDAGFIEPRHRLLLRYDHGGWQLRAPKTFQDRTLWPEFVELSKELLVHLKELTERVIREANNDDVSEAVEAVSPKALPVASQR